MRALTATSSPIVGSSRNSTFGSWMSAAANSDLMRCPNTTPMWWVYVSRSFQGTYPATRTSPELGTRIPASILIVVDLPAPLGPM